MPKIGQQSALRPRPLLGSAGFRRPCPPQKDPSDRIADRHAFALARRGTRPRAPQDQRTSSVYIFGAICPQQGKGAALVLPRCDTQAMSLHLAEVAQAVAPGAHGVLLMDRAGWHRAKDLVVPDASYRDIVDHCCDAWNRLIDQPWIIMSIGLRDWANA